MISIMFTRGPATERHFDFQGCLVLIQLSSAKLDMRMLITITPLLQ